MKSDAYTTKTCSIEKELWDKPTKLQLKFMILYMEGANIRC